MHLQAKAYAAFFEQLHAGMKKQEYARFFDASSVFEDPFQSVQGLDSIYGVFEHMYKTLCESAFFVEECISEKNVTFLRWRFVYKRLHVSMQESFIGVSRVTFGENGKVLSHVDYWDAAYNVYEKVPLLGAILRFIKRKIRA